MLRVKSELACRLRQIGFPYSVSKQILNVKASPVRLTGRGIINGNLRGGRVGV